MGIPNRGEGARTPMQKCLWTYHRIERFRKDILQMSQFDSLALGFYPDAGFFSLTLTLQNSPFGPKKPKMNQILVENKS